MLLCASMRNKSGSLLVTMQQSLASEHMTSRVELNIDCVGSQQLREFNIKDAVASHRSAEPPMPARCPCVSASMLGQRPSGSAGSSTLTNVPSSGGAYWARNSPKRRLLPVAR